MSEVTCIISWSLIPGIGLQDCTSGGLFTAKISRSLVSRVGKSTTCSKPEFLNCAKQIFIDILPIADYNDNLCFSGVFGWDFNLNFCYMCSPVEHYVCFYLIFFLYEIEDVPWKNCFRRCPR